MNGTEHRTQKRTHTYVSIFLLTNGQKEHNGREIAFSTNDAGAAGAMDMMGQQESGARGALGFQLTVCSYIS